MAYKKNNYLNNAIVRTAVAAAAAASGRKRKSAPSGRKPVSTTRTTRRSTIRRRRYKRNSQSGEYDYSKRSVIYGRPKRRTLREAFRKIDNQIERVTIGVQNVSAFGGANGAMFLDNGQTALGSQLILPCHLWDVTATINNVMGTEVVAPVFHVLRRSNETATADTVWWADSARRLAFWNSPESGSVVDKYPHNKAVVRWVGAKMMFYAPLNQPTKIQVDLVQFKDQRLVPQTVVQPATGTTTVTVADPFVTGFWDYMTSQYAWNPVQSQDTTYRKYVKFLKRATIYLDPKDTTDPSSSRYKELNFFMRLNKLIKYDWNRTDRIVFNAQDQQVNDGNVAAIAHPRARTYLMIRALGGRRVGAPEYSNTIHASYDMNLRMQYEIPN